MKKIKITALLGALSLLFQQANSETVVDFSGMQTGSNIPTLTFGGWSVDGSDNVRSAAFSTSALNSAPDDSDGLPVLFGGLWQRSIDGGASDIQPGFEFGVLTGGTPQADRLGITTQRGTGFENQARGILMTDFTDQGSFQFDSGSSLSITIDSGGNGGLTALNMVVLNGGSYYMSQDFQSGTSGTLTISDPESSNWTSFDPFASNFGDIDGTSISGSSLDLNDVQAVGFFFQKDGIADGSGTSTDRLDNWVVTATAIPEPGAMGAIFSVVTAFFVWRRFRK